VSVRIFGKNSEAIIERKIELESFSTLHAVGLGPALYGTFENGLVVGYVPGKPLTEAEMADDKVAAQIAAELAAWHSTVRVEEHGLVPRHGDRYCFGQMDEWRRTAGKLLPTLWKEKPEARRAFEAAFGTSFAEFDREAASLEATVLALRSPIVFSHNDLLGGNILHSEREGRVRFIDFEYASLNFRGFDIGDHFQEWTGLDLVASQYPSTAQQAAFIDAYLAAMPEGSGTREVVFREAAHFSLVTELFWISWAWVQACVSTIDFDYMAYAGKRWRRYLATKEERLAARLA
jgi:ethanolamine kinase